MKNLKLLLVSLALVLPCHWSYADQKENHKTRVLGETILRHTPVSTHRPNAPSKTIIECAYGDGFLEFTLPENVNTLTFLLYNGEEEISGVVTMENPVAEIPSLHGEYNLECQDDGNRTYTGILYFP